MHLKWFAFVCVKDRSTREMMETFVRAEPLYIGRRMRSGSPLDEMALGDKVMTSIRLMKVVDTGYLRPPQYRDAPSIAYRTLDPALTWFGTVHKSPICKCPFSLRLATSDVAYLGIRIVTKFEAG